jgi:hypothetical protein
MKQSTRITPPNSLVLVMDRSVGEIPKTMQGQAISATRTCIAIGTLSAADGETTVELTDETAIVPVGGATFEAVLDTPERKIVICSVLNETLMDCEVNGSRTKVRIWTNHPSEPDTVNVFVESL